MRATLWMNMGVDRMIMNLSGLQYTYDSCVPNGICVQHPSLPTFEIELEINEKRNLQAPEEYGGT